jgi:hypothetical protein
MRRREPPFIGGEEGVNYKNASSPHGRLQTAYLHI